MITCDKCGSKDDLDVPVRMFGISLDERLRNGRASDEFDQRASVDLCTGCIGELVSLMDAAILACGGTGWVDSGR